MAASYGVHDHGRDIIDRFFGRLSRLPRARGRKIYAFCCAGNSTPGLFRDVEFPHPACVCDSAFGDFDTHPGFRRRWERHKRIARWTIPIWLYVSVTGVLVYLMLYKWFPPPNLALGQ